MSSFLLYIKNTFLNQNKDSDFEKQGNHFKDKTFCFDSKITENNCMISSMDEKTFKLLYSLRDDDYLYTWEISDYSFEKYGIKKEDLSPKLTYEYLKTNKEELGINFSFEENEWINNWEDLLKRQENSFLKEIIFEKFCLHKIKDYYKNNNTELINEYKQHFEFHSISECIKNNMKYIISKDKKAEPKNFSDLKIFDNKIDCTNIMQGNLGTCYFLEALSTLSNYGQLLYQLFPQETINNEGYYELCLYTNGEWYKVLIDDYFIFQKRYSEDEPLEFLFTQPVKGCLYSCFLEKAYAKINGSYADIKGGYPSEAFTALTGYDSMYFPNQKINDEFIKQLKIFLEKGFLLSGASDLHAYSILRNKDDYFVIRNPWSSLRYKDILMQYNYNEKNKLKFDINTTIGEFKLREDDFKDFFNEGIYVGFCLFGTRIYKIKLEQIKSIKAHKNLYFYFETYELTKMVITLTEQTHMDEYSAKLELISDDNNVKEKNLFTVNDLKKKALQEKNNFEDYNFENPIDKGKYLGRINLTEKLSNYENKILTIIINKNININFLGYLDKKPDKSNYENNSSEIKYTNYFYGEKTAELRKKFKNVQKLMEYKGYKISDDCKGIYVETIFTNEVEGLFITDKKNKLKKCFSFAYSSNIYTYKEIDAKGNIIKEEKYNFNEINKIKIHDIPRSERDEDLSYEKIDIKTTRNNIYKDKLEEELNNRNNFIFEEEYAKCFFNNKTYRMELDDNELKFDLKGNIFNIFNNQCCYENDIMEIELKFNKKICHYASIKKSNKKCLCEIHIDMDIFFENANNIKRFVIRKPFRYFNRNLIEIIDNENLLYSIIEVGCCSNKHYEIISSINEKVGVIFKKNDFINNKKNNIYEIILNSKVDYKVKFLIIVGGIIILN